jgi:hypothetical protein
MRINIFTAPAIGLYLNKLRKNGQGKEANKFMADIEKIFRKRWEDFDKLYLNSERFSTTEFAGIFSLMCTEGGFLGLEIIRLIFIAGEAGESFVGCIKKGVENSKK